MFNLPVGIWALRVVIASGMKLLQSPPVVARAPLVALARQQRDNESILYAGGFTDALFGVRTNAAAGRRPR